MAIRYSLSTFCLRQRFTAGILFGNLIFYKSTIVYLYYLIDQTANWFILENVNYSIKDAKEQIKKLYNYNHRSIA